MSISLVTPNISQVTNKEKIYSLSSLHTLLDTSKKLTLRVHDECNGSDVFGSDICTCRPYLIYGIEECVKQAQQGGVGVIVYCKFLYEE